ncbi:orexin receptor type 2-like [Clytia hemisphaerica]
MNITATIHHNGSSTSPTPQSSPETSGPIAIFFFTYYALVFISGSIGNIVIIASVVKYKRMKTVVNIFLVNLAISDLLFVTLSIFDGIAFIADGKWLLGDAFCRIQGTMIEISYTVSVCTLTVVAAERYISICHPHRIKRTFQQAYNTCVFVWMFSVIFCSGLFYGYTTSPNDDGDVVCRNDYWSTESRLSFYIVHSILVYMVPLGVMCFSHWFISKALIRQKMRTFSTYSSSIDQITKDVDETDVNKNESQASHIGGKLDGKKEWKRNVKQANKRMKVVRLLLVVTIVFFVLWTPFIVVRLLKYFSVEINELLWRGTQLLIFGNTAVNCFIYALMSPAFREAFKGIFCCAKRLRNKNYSTSRSFDISETVKRKTSINNKVIYKV